MKIELEFLNNFKCAYAKSLPICIDETDAEIGTCKMSVENNRYMADLYFTDAVNEDLYLSCKWHIDENELITLDKIYLTEHVADDFSIQLKNANHN